MSMKAGTVLDISEMPTVILYVYEEKPAEEEASSEVDSSWVEDLE